MKKYHTIFLFNILLFITGCNGTINESTSISTPTQPTTSNTTSLVTSDENTFKDLECTIQKSIPNGWSYIPSEVSEGPEFYSDGGLKLHYEGSGIISPQFPNYSGELRISFKMNQLTKNNKISASSDHVFTITMLDNQQNVISEKYITIVNSRGTIGLTMEGNNVTQIKMILSGYPLIEGFYYNVGISSFSIKRI